MRIEQWGILTVFSHMQVWADLGKYELGGSLSSLFKKQ